MAETTQETVENPADAAEVPVIVAAPGPQAEPQPVEAQVEPSAPPSKAGPEDLPDFTRSLLRVRLSVEVTLAQKRQPVAELLELVPGALIQFDKSCEEMLQLSVSDHPIAMGEAVKVGDKFGLRITSIVLPDERFKAVRA